MRYRYRRNNKHEEWVFRKAFIQFKSTILDLDFGTVDMAGQTKTEFSKKFPSFGLADAIILSHAQKENAKVFTGDRHFKGLQDFIFIE